MRVPVPGWPGQRVRGPLGLSLYLTAADARKLNRPSQTRSVLARAIVDCIAAQRPTRRIRGLSEGGYATTEGLQPLPASVEVGSRRLLTGKLSAPPLPRATARRGGHPRKALGGGAPKPLARKRSGWQPHPTEAAAFVPAWTGRRPPVLPGRLRRVVVVRRPKLLRARKLGQRKPPPPVEAVFSTAPTLRLDALLAQYRERWAVEIPLRAGNAFASFGQDQCRKRERVGDINPLRLVRTAARPLWCGEYSARTPTFELRRYRPWSRLKVAPSQLDIVWTGRAGLLAAGVLPLPRFTGDLAEIHQESENAFPLAASLRETNG
jgi:hypothetical protein